MGSIFVGTPIANPPVGQPASLAPNCGGTWLSLDRWAQIIGINPLHFHQLTSSTLIPNTVCGDAFFQNSWQHSDRIGRDDICMAIQQAEQDIAREVGYNLMPDWTLDERLSYPHPSPAELYGTGVNTRWGLKSVEALRGHLITGGIRAKTLVEATAGITRTDADGDGYAETCSIIVPVTFTDTNEVHVYYPGQSGNDAWEIRPILVSIAGGNATVTFKVWQVALATALFAINPEPLDANLAASYETTVDVYRVYNDPSTQVQFLWEGGADCCGSCTACQLGAQTGCFHLRDARLGILVPAAADWNATTSGWDGAEWTACREPDQLRLWYYSGWRDQSLLRPYADLSPYWEYAIAYLAASRLDKPVCGCSNVSQFIDKWRMDSAFASDAGSFTLTAEMASNRLGTTAGALYAYRAIQKNGVRINK